MYSDDEIPSLLAMEDERVSLELALFHYVTTPPITNDAEHALYTAQLTEMLERRDVNASPEAEAMVWAVMDRIMDYDLQDRSSADDPFAPKHEEETT
ncbi:hypothetical protein PVV74_13795 [Roseovarius sp. SK2]|uniref:hypothetical protein n=1 Tax=Roseovarius TaxID=74030 RepID=UPI00237BB8D6|nr:hypothetical protein [Roseovarius sp. SK2]MDD9726538.1 hypothetical protein [Roseovarius sp. SK2]